MKAEESKVDMDAILSEAFFAFYWLSNNIRTFSIGMTGIIENPLPLNEVREYYRIFKPVMSEEHFINVIYAADVEYRTYKAETRERSDSSNKKHRK